MGLEEAQAQPLTVAAMERTSFSMLFKVSPQLICLEKSASSLTFSHFGNISIYNSLKPNLTLNLLRAIKKQKTIEELQKEFGTSHRKIIKQELDRLISINYVYSFKPKTLVTTSPSFLKHFYKNKVAENHLAQKLADTKVTIVDFCNTGKSLKTTLKEVGFKKINIVKNLNKKSSATKQTDFFIVVGSTKQKFIFSKTNQILFFIKKPWLLVTLDTFGGIIGPTFGVAGGPCYDCIIDHNKRHGNAHFNQKEYVDLLKPESSSDFSDQFVAKSIFPYVCTESIKIISKVMRPASFDGFYIFDLINFRTLYNVVSLSPLCPVCSKYI